MGSQSENALHIIHHMIYKQWILHIYVRLSQGTSQLYNQGTTMSDIFRRPAIPKLSASAIVSGWLQKAKSSASRLKDLPSGCLTCGKLHFFHQVNHMIIEKHGSFSAMLNNQKITPQNGDVTSKNRRLNRQEMAIQLDHQKLGGGYSWIYVSEVC